MSLYGEREEGTTDSKMSFSGEREEENTASKMSLSGEREDGTTDSKMSLYGEREDGTTASKMTLFWEREDGTTASKMTLFWEREDGNTDSKMTQDTSSKCVQKPRAESPTTSLLSMKSDQPPAFSQEPLPDDNKEVESLDSEDVLKITHNLLDRRSQTLLTVQQDVKAKLKHKYQHISEGIGHHGNQSLFKDIYTELYITEGGGGGLNNEHEVRQIEMASKKQPTQETPIKCNDIFKPLPGQDKPIRTVLTKGIAGIGKTVSVQKVVLDWAEGKANQDVHFMFPLPFRDLNLKKDQYSLMQLLSHYFSELKEIDSIEDGETKTVFIFDGLDEYRLPLDFKNNETCCDVTKPTSVDVLLTNLIKGNLLPSALLWITSRPAAANQIPPECVDQVTEVRGFNDAQKEEYFRKNVTDQNLANEIIKHMKTSRSLHIMCHMPVFCWISATVLEMILKEAEKDEVPKNLTQMYSHFMLIQIIVKNRKYNKTTETNPKELSQSDKEMILKLAKLAFQQLQKGNLIFYEEDLRECGLDVTEASEYSALCTEIFKEESGLYQDKVYSFVHLSIQEFLAAVHALESCLDKKENVFFPTSDDEEEKDIEDDEEKGSIQLSDLHRRAVDQALKSENGHLDLFLRFLLGLSLASNQNLLRGLLTQTGSTTQTNERTVRYLSDKINQESSPERIINLFHCLNELGSNSLVEDMQTSLHSGTLSETRLKPDQCSALAYLLLMSEEVLEEFDLKTCNTSEKGYQRLLPVVRTCKRALLDRCKLTYKSCETLTSALQTPNSPVRELDLSYNDLGDRGVELLCVGLTSPLCNIQTLVLVDCKITHESCEILTSALQTPQLYNSPLRELDLSYNDLGDRGVELLCVGLTSPLCNIQTLVLVDCKITYESCETLASALQTPNSPLRELDLSYNDLGDRGVELLCVGLTSPLCNIQTLVLAECYLTYESCETLASALQTPNSPLRELDLSYNDLGDRGVELLCVGLTSPLCNIQTLVLGQCGLTEGCCSDLASVLSLPNSQLNQLELRDNDLQDSGVTLLSAGLEDPDCKLHTLGLSGCLVTEEGCAALSSALRSNPSHLNELDLSYNHPGDSAGGLLSAALVDPTYKLMKLNVDHGGECRLKSGPRKYACHLTLDPNTANPHLILSEGNKKLKRVVEDQHYEDHPDRFDFHPQVLCREGLSGGRYYWEVERDGDGAFIGVLYKGMKRKGGESDSRIGHNKESWCLVCYDRAYNFYHNGVIRYSRPNTCPVSKRVGVYLDWPAGTLSFYSVSSSGTVTHFYTEHTTFTEPLYPGFIMYSSSSLTLCPIDDQHIQRDHGGESFIKPGPEDTRDHGGESCIEPGPENTRDHGGESWIKPGPEDPRDHGGESCIKPGPEDTRDHGGECWIKPGPEDTRDHGGESWIKPGPEDPRDHGGESCIKPGPEDTRDHGGECWIKPGPEDTRDHGGESCIKPGPEDTRDHGGESCIKPGPEDTRDHGGECWIKPGPEDTRDHGGESWTKFGPEDTRDHGGESWTKFGPEDTRDHGGESCIKPGPEDTRDHGGECWIKPGPEDTRDHGGESWTKFGSEKWIPQSCKTCDHVEDSTHWLQIEPLTSTVQGVTMFRHRTPRGSYECTVSGLRWLCERDVILKYHFRNWEPYSQLLKDMQYTQGGPLLDITMELGELEEVHLPHCVCLGTNPSLRNEMKILHVEEHGVSLEEVHEVTRFHAKILHPKFSPISLILRLLSRNVDVHCELLLYLTVMKETLIPRLYLFPSNPGQIQAVEQQEIKFQGSKRIPITRPERSFKLKSSFRLNIPCSTSINPPRIHLIHRDTTPSFFKAVVKMTGIDIEMELFGDDERTVWTEIVSRDEYYQNQALTLSGIPAEEFLKKHRAELIQGVKNTMPIADDLSSKSMIGDEEYSRIKAETTEQERMRELLNAVLPKGPEVMGACLKALSEHEHHLVKYLSESST
ncbi:NACHT, LRR and PYD domains-containing protein 5-like isoform X2 [Oncorhynchus masou masou]|uniref:NACHT, LRR and PYD domains-containing protein 5-like isoform X2 n=1 Tax=Oncorhynchus masou masou TaxID=90313 RepID=UPI0031843FAB